MSSSRPAMKKAGVKPNEVTYNTVINAHTQKGDPEGVSVPPMRMAGAQWGSAFFSPWYVSYSRFPPRRKSRMAELAGCQARMQCFSDCRATRNFGAGGGALLLQLAVDF